MSIRRRQIASRLLRALSQGERLPDFNLTRVKIARGVLESGSRMGRYLRYRRRRWREFLEWVAR